MEQTIKQLTDALNECIEIQDQLSEALTECENENTFLTETIVNNNLGLIVTERRELLSKNRDIKYDADKAINEANAIKNEYSQRLDKIAKMIKDVSNKQSSIDKCIDSEADKKISNLKQANSEMLKKERQKLQKEYQKLEADIRQKLKFHRIIAAISISVGAIGILVGVLI